MSRLPILDKLDQELKESNQELQVEIPKAIKTAREHGDLSENAEFKAAKERQMLLESRISLLQKRISDITSIDLNKIPDDRSGLGSTLICVISTRVKKFNIILFFLKRLTQMKKNYLRHRPWVGL